MVQDGCSCSSHCICIPGSWKRDKKNGDFLKCHIIFPLTVGLELFSSFEQHQDHLERRLKHRLLGSAPRVSDLSYVQGEAQECAFLKFPGDAAAAGLGSSL